jgi:hypothetical protein
MFRVQRSYMFVLMAAAFSACSGQSNAPSVPAVLPSAAAGSSFLSPEHKPKPTPTPKATPIIVSTCTTIAAPGTYELTGNVNGSTGQICIAIQNTSKVTLNCQNHTITGSGAVSVSNVVGYTVENCSLQPLSSGYLLDIENSSNGTITNNIVGYPSQTPGTTLAPINVAHSTGLSILSNTIYEAYQQNFSTGSVISKNTMSCPLTICASVIIMNLGSSNQVTDNKIDGGAGIDAADFTPGSDDGIDPADETSDVIESNTIKNVWDCGIEISGSITSATISKNAITNASNCGIGGWYNMSLSNSTIADNTVSGSADLFQFMRIYGLRPAGWAEPGWPADTGVFFTGNKFEKNTFTNPYPGGDGAGTGDSSFIPFDDAGLYMGYSGYPGSGGNTSPTPSQFYLSNNTFTKNNFGANPAYFGEPALKGAVIDGGGNICARTTYSDYPLACGKP